MSSILTLERLDDISYPEWHQKGKKVESPKDNSTAATGFVAKLDTFQPICGFFVTTKGSDWIIDTGATNHMTCDRNMFTQFSSNSFVSVIINAMVFLPQLWVVVQYPFLPCYPFLMFFLFILSTALFSLLVN